MEPKDACDEGMCPFLHEVGNDVVCIYPQTLYCVGAEHGKPRFPSRATAQRYCLDHFERCEGFQRRAARDPS